MNPQDNLTLQAELEQILHILHKIVAPEHPWFNPDKAVEQAINSILATVSKHLPEKKKEKLYAGEPYSLVGKEWNDAITEMEQRLQGKDE